MRKSLLFAMLFLIMTAFIFVSCNGDAVSDSGASSNSGTSSGGEASPNTNTDGEPKTMNLVVPCVGGTEPEAGSRGLQNMVASGDVFDTEDPMADINYAQAVMQCMPVFPSLRTVENVSADTSLTDLNLSFNMFGFECRLDGNKSKLNEDGAYLRYNVVENDAIVGVMEYYYNVPNNRITYRQYMMLNVLVQTGPDAYQMVTNAVMVYCIEDVELGEDMSLKANQVVNGTLKSDEAYLDMFFLGSTIFESNPYENRLERRVITIASDGDKTCAFTQPWSSKSIPYTPWENSNSELQTIMKKYTKDDSYQITVEKCENFTVEAAFDFIDALYVNGEKARKGNWETYDEFIAWDLDDFSDSAPELPNSDQTMWMSYFKLSDAQDPDKRGNRAYYDSNPGAVNYTYAGFGSVYGSYVGEATTEYDKVFEKFLPDCGIAPEDIHIVKTCLGDLLTTPVYM